MAKPKLTVAGGECKIVRARADGAVTADGVEPIMGGGGAETIRHRLPDVARRDRRV